MRKEILLGLLVVCVAGYLLACGDQETGSKIDKVETASEFSAVIDQLQVSRIYEQPQDKDLVHIKMQGSIIKVDQESQGYFTLETAFQEIGTTKEISGIGENSPIYVGNINRNKAINNKSDNQIAFYSREFDINLYEPLEVQKQAGKEFRLIIYLKKIVDEKTNERVTLERKETTFVFKASPIQPYQIQK